MNLKYIESQKEGLDYINESFRLFRENTNVPRLYNDLLEDIGYFKELHKEDESFVNKLHATEEMAYLFGIWNTLGRLSEGAKGVSI